jgi:hypothetical protein
VREKAIASLHAEPYLDPYTPDFGIVARPCHRHIRMAQILCPWWANHARAGHAQPGFLSASMQHEYMPPGGQQVWLSFSHRTSLARRKGGGVARKFYFERIPMSSLVPRKPVSRARGVVGG